MRPEVPRTRAGSFQADGLVSVSGLGGMMRAGVWFAGLLVAAPLFSLVLIAITGTPSLLGHTLAVTLPMTARDTLLLGAGVALVTAVLGLSTAWTVALFEFPGRRFLSVALAMPLAVPTYLVAYVYVALFDGMNTLSSLSTRLIGAELVPAGFSSTIRSLPGAALIMGSVLFPYIYLPVQSAISRQGTNLIDSARLLGASPSRVFITLVLPLSRPAFALGLTLVLLETLNDLGASDYFGVQTFTVSIYTTWLNRGSLPGAAQLAFGLMVCVALLLFAEHWARGDRRFAYQRQSRPVSRKQLRGFAAVVAFTLCLVPVSTGFLLPVAFLIFQAFKRSGQTLSADVLAENLLSTLAYSAIATASVVVFSLVVLVASRFHRSFDISLAGRFAGFGYAVPGTVLAVGLLGPLAGIDNLIANFIREVTHQRIGLLLIGSGAALIIAYTIRFMTIGIGTIGAGYARAPRSLDDAARMLGRSPWGVFSEVHWPLLRPAMAIACLLVFIDAIKELPATLLLRPLNVDTLATHIYSEASRGTFENGAVSALVIVLAGTIPAMISVRLFDQEPMGRN